jgi:hypothetical protein
VNDLDLHLFSDLPRGRGLVTGVHCNSIEDVGKIRLCSQPSAFRGNKTFALYLRCLLSSLGEVLCGSLGT